MKKLFILILLLFIENIALALDDKNIIRVGISDSSFSVFEHSEAEFIADDSATISDMSSDIKKDLNKQDIVSVKFSNGFFTIDVNEKNEIQGARGPVVITSSGKIGIVGLKRKGDPAYYRGIIELKSVNENKFNIINVLDIQSYLKGVVPNEMPVSFGIEALKAQAVAARNYAGRKAKYHLNYDLCDSVACQVYYGANSETNISNNAVEETLGIYALYNNEPILALYSSTASGISEDYYNTFGNFEEDKPYLKSVADSEKLTKLKDEEYFKTSPPSFDMNSPKYRWEKPFDRFELENILSKTLLEQSNAGNVFPKFTGEDKFYGLEDIKILKKGKSKKALEIEIKSVSGDYVIKKELPIRRVFGGLPSANFIIDTEKKSKDKTEEEGEIVFQNEHKIYRNHFGKKLPSKFVFYGAGFGHGVGMSQYGAGYLSKAGVSYDKILKHYYTGIKLGTMPKTVSYNNLNLDYVEEFYYLDNKKTKAPFFSKDPMKDELKELLNNKEKQKYYLIIENPGKVSDVSFFINDYFFSPNMGGFRKKTIETEITDYLKEGKNKIVFKPLKLNDKKKSIKFYIAIGDENE